MAPKKRALCSSNQLQQAMDSVSGGMSVNRASEEYNIPRRTLRNHIRTGQRQKKLGMSSTLNESQENELCSRIIRLSEVGMPITQKVLRRSVFSYVEEKNIKDNRMAGRKWMKLFLNRHENIRIRKAQILNPARSQKMNEYIVSDYFKKLESVLVKLNLMNQPHRIYNIDDEKGYRLTIHHQPNVLVEKGVKRMHCIASEHAENVTIVACGNALGQAIPSMILFKGKLKKDEWKDSMPPGTEIGMTAKGSMTTHVFTKWLNHFSKFKSPGDTLLIFDGAASHLDASIVTEAEKYQITLLCLPSNTTHELQPLDESVFRSFEYHWDNEVIK